MRASPTAKTRLAAALLTVGLLLGATGCGGGAGDAGEDGREDVTGAAAQGAGDGPSGGGRPDDDESGPDAVAGTWTGTVTTAEVRESALVGAGYTASGDMWFTVDEEGRIEGRAIVVYQPTVDLGGLNGALGTIKSLGTAAVGAFPGVFGIMPFIVEGLTTDIVAVRGTYSLPAYTVDREITGTYTEGLGMSLEWASDPALEMPIRFFLDGVGTQEQIHQAVLAAEHPWGADAQASDTAGVRLVTAQDTAEEGSTADGGVRTARSVTWFAERS